MGVRVAAKAGHGLRARLRARLRVGFRVGLGVWVGDAGRRAIV